MQINNINNSLKKHKAMSVLPMEILTRSLVGSYRVKVLRLQLDWEGRKGLACRWKVDKWLLRPVLRAPSFWTS